MVYLAALVGLEREEKRKVVEHLARHMRPGALLVVRSARGARAFLYPVVETEEDLNGFEVLSVHHPDGEVVNSVIVARKKGIHVISCKCNCEPLVSDLGHGYGCLVDELAVDGHQSS